MIIVHELLTNFCQKRNNYWFKKWITIVCGLTKKCPQVRSCHETRLADRLKRSLCLDPHNSNVKIYFKAIFVVLIYSGSAKACFLYQISPYGVTDVWWGPAYCSITGAALCFALWLGPIRQRLFKDEDNLSSGTGSSFLGVISFDLRWNTDLLFNITAANGGKLY